MPLWILIGNQVSKRKTPTVIIALVISVTFNALLLLLGTLAGARLKLPEILLFPGRVVTSFVPAGHDASQFLLAITGAIVACVTFYTAVAWLVVMACLRLRGRNA